MPACLYKRILQTFAERHTYSCPICFAPYNIVLFAALSLVHSLLPLWSTYFLRNVSSHSLCLPFSSVAFKWSDWGHIYWQINRLLLPYRLPSGSVPHCISNQICHRQPPRWCRKTLSTSGGAVARWLAPSINIVDAQSGGLPSCVQRPISSILEKPGNSKDVCKEFCSLW